MTTKETKLSKKQYKMTISRCVVSLTVTVCVVQLLAEAGKLNSKKLALGYLAAVMKYLCVRLYLDDGPFLRVQVGKTASRST